MPSAANKATRAGPMPVPSLVTAILPSCSPGVGVPVLTAGAASTTNRLRGGNESWPFGTGVWVAGADPAVVGVVSVAWIWLNM